MFNSQKKSVMIGKFYTTFIILFIPLGLLFYNCLGIQLIDELLVAILVLFTFLVRLHFNKKFSKEFLAFVIISLFYLGYSIILKTTSTIAVLYDFQQQVKPFVVFYCTSYLNPQFNKRQIQIISITCIIAAIVTMCAIPQSIASTTFMGGHITSLASLSTALFCILYYLNQRRSWSLLFILSLGLFSMRAKFFVTYAFSIMLLYIHKRVKLFNIKVLLISGILIFILINYVIWDKFNFYFIQGSEDNSGVLRSLFYITFFKILIDYFPFGSGLATFSNNASGVFYSPLYYKYDLWEVRGCTPDDPSFVADTFYPNLAQFGIVGVFLFFYFLYKRYHEIIQLKSVDKYLLGLVVLITILFESVADTMILSNRGVLFFFILGMLRNDLSKSNS